MKKLIAICVLVSMVLVVSGLAQAALDIRIDIEDAPITAGNWNNLFTTGTSGLPGQMNITTSDLKDFSGSVTVVSITGAGWDVISGAEPWTSTIDWVEATASTDAFVVTNGGLATMTLSGLDSTKLYKVEVVSSYQSSNFGTVSLTIDGAIDDVYADANYKATKSVDVSSGWDMRNIDDWMIWNNIATDVSGDLVISVQNDGTSHAMLNAVRISEVPEPATMLLLGLGGLVLRKRKA